MNCFRKFIAFSLLWILPVVGSYADHATDRATDIGQMKRVWEALMSFQKAKGALPESLGELMPEFLADPKILLSPKDDGRIQNRPATAKDQKHPSSYSYEWNSQPFGALTVRQVKSSQLEEFDPIVPLLRCSLYRKVLNISHAEQSGEVVASF